MEFGEGEVSETARSGAGVLYYGDMLLVRTALSLHWNNIKGRIRGGFLEENLNGVVTRVAPRFIQFRSNFVEIDFHCVKINFVLDPEASCHFANRYWNAENLKLFCLLSSHSKSKYPNLKSLDNETSRKQFQQHWKLNGFFWRFMYLSEQNSHPFEPPFPLEAYLRRKRQLLDVGWRLYLITFQW